MDSKELFREAQRFFIEGKHKESMEAFTKVIESGEKSEIAYLSRGAAYFQLKEYDKAIADFSAVIGKNEKNARAYFYRAMSYNAKGEYIKRITITTTMGPGIKVNPSDTHKLEVTE